MADKIPEHALRIDIDKVAFSRKLSTTVKATRGFSQDIRRANEQSIEILSRMAAANLQERIDRNPYQDRVRTGQLKAAILNEKSHAATTKGFQFMIDKAMRQQANYYRVVEVGTPKLVGRRIYLIFAGQRNQLGDAMLLRAPLVPAGKRFTKKEQKKARVAIIKHPIPAYRYAEKAIEKFTTDGTYREFVREAARVYEEKTGVAVRL